MAQTDITKPKRKKVFKNFAEYWHYAKVLSEDQRQLLANSLSREEFKSLKSSYNKGGWEDLFMRNACDTILDKIKQQYGVDLVLVRAKVLAGKPQMMQEKFWVHITNCFDKISFAHLVYIFGGVMIHDADEDGYMKLTKA